MNGKNRNNAWKSLAICAAICAARSNEIGIANGAEWFGGASKTLLASIKTPETQALDATANLVSSPETDPTEPTSAAETASESNAPLYAEGEDAALNSFQRGMISVQEFAASTFRVASASTRRPYPTSGLIAEAQWLNWRVSSTNTLYATSYSSSGNFIDGDRFGLTTKGNGVRARLGKRFDDCWDLTFCYTYFDGSDSGTQSNGTQYYNVASSLSTSTLVPDLVSTQPTAATPETFSIVGDVAASLNVFDLEFGRWICPGSTALEFRPFGGLRAAKTYEKYGGVYNSGLSRTIVEQSTKGTGYGIRGGGAAKWNVAGGWSVFGSGALSVLATTLVNKTYQEYTYTGSPASEVWLDYDAHSRVATPVLDVEAGVSWRRGGWEIKGGYELSDWFNASNLDAPGGDLLFYGYFAGASWNF